MNVCKEQTYRQIGKLRFSRQEVYCIQAANCYFTLTSISVFFFHFSFHPEFNFYTFYFAFSHVCDLRCLT